MFPDYKEFAVLSVFFLIAVAAGSIISGASVKSPDFRFSDISIDSLDSEPEIPEKNYSVIMVSIETLRADHLPCYGYYRNTAPELCEFGRENVMFRQGTAQATWTIPSEASVFTSQYPMVHGVLDRTDRIPDSKVLMAEAVPGSYRKAAFTGGMDIQSRYGFAQGFDMYSTTGNAAGFEQTIPPALEWLEENRDNNFFLFIQGYNPHSPYGTHEPYRDRYTGNYSGVLENYTIDADINDEKEILDQLKRRPGKNYTMTVDGEMIQLSEEDINYTIDRYDAGVRHTDDLLADFFNELKSRGLYNDTVIVVYSNHGEALNDHVSPGFYINGHRRAPFSEQVNVPFMMRIPGIEEKAVEGPVELIDIYPTILDILGKEPVEEVQGDSLLDDIRRGESDGPAFSEGAGFQAESVTTKDWKYLYIPDYYGVGELGGGDTRILYWQPAGYGSENLYQEYPGVVEEMKELRDSWKISNIKLSSDSSKSLENSELKPKTGSEQAVNTSPMPVKWWTHIENPPHAVLKSSFCQDARLAMGRVISPYFRVCTNSDGFRDEEYSVEKPGDTFRVVALGDAITFGVGVNASQSWPEYLEKALNREYQNTDYQVLNFGLPFKTTKEEVEFFQMKALKYEPDLVVLQYMENDAENLSRINELEEEFKKNLSNNLTDAQRNRVAVTKAILAERRERQAMSIEEEMETVDPYLDRLDEMSEEHDFDVMVMYFATHFTRRHVDYIRNASEERGWSFMISDLDGETSRDLTYGETFNMRPFAHNLTAVGVKDSLKEEGLVPGEKE